MHTIAIRVRTDMSRGNQLHGHRVLLTGSGLGEGSNQGGGSTASSPKGQLDTPDTQLNNAGLWPSSTWAKWALGMIDLLAQQLSQYDCHKVARAEFSWEDHVRNGHWPPSRRCRVCIASGAKQRPHRRVETPASWVLSADTIGPFKRAEDETTNDLRYVLVTCLLVPVDDKGRPVMGEEQVHAEEVQEARAEGDNPPDHKPEIDDPLEDITQHEVVEDAVPEPDEQAVEACEQDAQGLSPAEKLCHVPGMRWKELVFTEPMKRKSPAAVEHSLTKIILEIRELGFPVVRIHSDSGSEFISQHMRRLVTKYGIRQTCSAPEEHNSNGRIENVVRRLKSQIRSHLYMKGSDVSLWPLAARAASAVWRTSVLKGMGKTMPAVVPFGTSVQVLARTWLRRNDQQTWSLRAVPAMVLCPASLIKLGYVVRVKKCLSVVTKLFEGEDPPIATSVQVEEPPLAHSVGPESRITGKATRPDMSHVPPPAFRIRHKSPGPGRVPVASKLYDSRDPAREDQEAYYIACEDPFDVQKASVFLCKSTFVERNFRTDDDDDHGYQAQHYLFGAYSSGEKLEASAYCELRPGMCELLTKVVATSCPSWPFSTLLPSVGTVTYPSGRRQPGPGLERHVIMIRPSHQTERVWVQLQSGMQVQGDTVIIQKDSHMLAGQCMEQKDVVTIPGDTTCGTMRRHTQQQQPIVITASNLPEMAQAPTKVKQKLRKHRFVLSEDRDKGGDPQDAVFNQQRTTNHFYSHSIPQSVGSGEGQSRDQACRACDSEGSIDQLGFCAECGIWTGPKQQFSMPEVLASAQASYHKDTKNPKNGILGAAPKDHCTLSPKNSILKNKDGSIDHEDFDQRVQQRPEIFGVTRCGWIVRIRPCEVVEGSCKEPYVVWLEDRVEELTNCDDADEPEESSDDAEQVSCGWLEVVWLGPSRRGVKLSTEDEAIGHERQSVCVVERGQVDTEGTEHLKAISDDLGSGAERRRATEDFMSWLDERQLRLAGMHVDEVESWVAQESPCDDDSWKDCPASSQAQRLWNDVESLRQELKQMSTQQTVEDMHELMVASSPTTDDTEVVLQTRIIANAQVMSDWETWEPATRVEIDGLIVGRQALELSSQKYLDSLQTQGFTVVLIPSKAIYSLKAPCGRRKCRLVACGNFLSSTEGTRQAHKQVVYTASIGIESLRAGLAFSVRRQHVLLTLDIKAAFLNAQLLPRDRREAEIAVGEDNNCQVQGADGKAGGNSSGEEGNPVASGPKEVVALIPPRMLITKGVFAKDARLLVKKAVYGLDQSPRDWAMLRDRKLAEISARHEGVKYKLFQSHAEDSMWMIAPENQAPLRGAAATACEHDRRPEVSGWAAVYVDDILLAAPEGIAWAMARAIGDMWECSVAQEVGRDPKAPVRFLGIDLCWSEAGDLALSQAAYITDLGKRYEDELKSYGRPTTPMSGSFDEDGVDEAPALEQIRRSQALIGELLWASIRTRPDISYTVARLAGHMNRAPVAVFKAGLHALAYLLDTVDMKLIYRKQVRKVWNEYKRYPNPYGMVEGFGDASFAPEARRSVQCLQVYIEGSLTAWSVTRQAFMAQSSCEAEMIALMDLANYILSNAFLVDELLQRRVSRQLACDNSAALAIYGGTSMHWRTRHLRIRAKAFIEKCSEGLLPAHHVSGEWNPADLGTKALAGARHWKLCDLVGLAPYEASGKRKDAPNKTQSRTCSSVCEP